MGRRIHTIVVFITYTNIHKRVLNGGHVGAPRSKTWHHVCVCQKRPSKVVKET